VVLPCHPWGSPSLGDRLTFQWRRVGWVESYEAHRRCQSGGSRKDSTHPTSNGQKGVDAKVRRSLRGALALLWTNRRRALMKLLAPLSKKPRQGQIMIRGQIWKIPGKTAISRGQIIGQIITGRARVSAKIGDMTIEHEASTSFPVLFLDCDACARHRDFCNGIASMSSCGSMSAWCAFIIASSRSTISGFWSATL